MGSIFNIYSDQYLEGSYMRQRLVDTYTYEELSKFCKESFSYADLSRKIGYASLSNYDALKDVIKKYNLDISHFDPQKKQREKVNLDIYYNGSRTKTKTLIHGLIVLRGYKCEKCGIREWQDQKIVLQLHHIDGNHLNNELTNLQLLCPNCHSQTDNFCGKNRNPARTINTSDFTQALQNTTSIRDALISMGIYSVNPSTYGLAHYLIEKFNIDNQIWYQRRYNVKPKKEIKYYTTKEEKRCVDCGKIINPDATRCIDCEHKRQRKTEWPQRDELKELIRVKSFSAIGRMYNVSDNAVRKWCKNYNLPTKKSEIKQYSDKEWEEI